MEQLFLISGGLTLAYMTKLFVKLFVEKPEGEQPKVCADRATLCAIVPAAAALVVMGLIPSLTYGKIAAFDAASLRCSGVDVAWFSLENLKGAAISLTIGAGVYLLIVRGLMTEGKAYRKPTTVLDLEDDVYRPLLNLLSFLGALGARAAYALTDGIAWAGEKLLYLGSARRVDPGKDHHFSHYSRQYVRFNPIKQTLSFELMLFGIGVMLVLLYLLIQL